MTRMVKCAKLGKQAEGMDRPPLPGEIGQRIYDSISKEAWQQWMRHQTILINENRLSVIDPKHRAFLEEQMLKFLFEDSAEMPDAFTPPENES